MSAEVRTGTWVWDGEKFAEVADSVVTIQRDAFVRGLLVMAAAVDACGRDLPSESWITARLQELATRFRFSPTDSYARCYGLALKMEISGRRRKP